ncbi:MAG: SDR family NAD(P)-dependent oxidoreductase [Solirubrobacteraceae bacterium]
MKKTVLITGASSGIGLELAKIFASKGNNLVLVARSLQKLEELKNELERDFSVSVLNIKKDLSIPNSASEVYNEVKQHQMEINYLVNNAGVGVFGPHIKTDWENEKSMIQLNITSLTELTKLFVKDMVNKKSGKIMNVASVAAFVPGPNMSIYFASKAFVLNYSEALRSELSKYGISVTTLCPGATQTNFFDPSPNFKNRTTKTPLPTAKEVAQYGYSSMLNGNSIAIHGIKNKIAVLLTKFSPRNLTLKITKKIANNF